MEWSEKFPKVEGFYWFRYRNNETGLGKPVIIAISMSYLNGEEFGMSATRIGDDEIYMDTDFKGVWFGPITPPKSDTAEAVEQPLTQVKSSAGAMAPQMPPTCNECSYGKPKCKYFYNSGCCHGALWRHFFLT